MDLTLPDELARFRPHRLLGAGAFGRVILAEDHALGRQVAIKLLSSDRIGDRARERFVREAHLTSRLRHPGIVQVYDAGATADGTAYIVYEFVDGESLEQYLQREALPGREQVLTWGSALAEALQAAHDSGVLHRDVKPANVLLRASGEPVLCDFGLALDTDGHASRTTQGKLLGTLAYMAPELLTGARASPASDQYSLGATLFRAAFGVPLRTADDLQDLVKGTPAPARSRIPGTLRGRSPRLEACLLRALETDPAARFPGSADLAAGLRGEQSLDSLAGQHRTRVLETTDDRAEDLRPPLTTPSPWRRRLALGGALICFTLCLGLLAPSPPSPDPPAAPPPSPTPEVPPTGDLRSLIRELGLLETALWQGHPDPGELLDRVSDAHALEALDHLLADGTVDDYLAILEVAERWFPLATARGAPEIPEQDWVSFERILGHSSLHLAKDLRQAKNALAPDLFLASSGRTEATRQYAALDVRIHTLEEPLRQFLLGQLGRAHELSDRALRILGWISAWSDRADALGYRREVEIRRRGPGSPGRLVDLVTLEWELTGRVLREDPQACQALRGVLDRSYREVSLRVGEPGTRWGRLMAPSLSAERSWLNHCAGQGGSMPDGVALDQLGARLEDHLGESSRDEAALLRRRRADFVHILGRSEGLPTPEAYRRLLERLD